MIVHTFHHGTTMLLHWDVDVEGSIVGASCAETAFVISENPALTPVQFQTDSSDYQTDQLIFLGGSAAIAGIVPGTVKFPLNFPISIGDRIYSAVAAVKANVQLFIEFIPS